MAKYREDKIPYFVFEKTLKRMFIRRGKKIHELQERIAFLEGNIELKNQTIKRLSDASGQL